MKLVERGVQTKESRHIIRVMRTLLSTRKRLNDFVLKRVLNFFYVPQSVQADKEFLFKYIDVNAISSSTSTSSASPSAVALMETDDTIVVIKTEPTSTPTVQAKSKGSSVVLPEVDLYLHLLVLLYSIDKKKFKLVISSFFLLFA